MKIGESYFVPNSSIEVSTLETSLRRRGMSWNLRKSSRLARSVTSSSMPEAIYPKCAGGHVLAGNRFEVEHVDRVLWAIDQIAAARRRPDHRIGQFGRRFHAEGAHRAGRQQRTCREVLQKMAAAGGANDR